MDGGTPASFPFLPFQKELVCITGSAYIVIKSYCIVPAGYKTISPSKNGLPFWNIYRFHNIEEGIYNNFLKDETNKGRTYSAYGVTSWYPAAGYRASTHGLIINATGYAVYRGAKTGQDILFNINSDSGLNVSYNLGHACGASVRCQKM